MTSHPSGPRTLCVLVPSWPLEVARRQDRIPADGPAAVYREGFVVAVSPEAAAEGVLPGQKRREAEAICPVMARAESDPGGEAAAFEPVALALETIVPRIEIAEPGLAYLPASGALRYFGGAEATGRAALDAARTARACTARVGLARGPFAARQAALHAPDHDPVLVVHPAGEPAFLGELPVTVLDTDLASALRRLGITTLGHLAALPRASVTARFGAAGLAAHRLAHGDDRLAAPRAPRTELQVEMAFDEPVTDLETAAFTARALGADLSTRLDGEGLSAFSVEVASGSLSRTWRSLDPLDEKALSERGRWQVTAWSEAGLLPDGLHHLRLTPVDVTGSGRQLSLLADAAADADASRAYARIQALLGPDAVRRSVLQGGRGPGDRHRFVRHGEPDPGPPDDRPPDAPWPGRLPSPAPALVMPAPTPVAVHEEDGVPVRVVAETVTATEGPWRLREAWWDDTRSRDLEWWKAVTASGTQLLARRCDAGTWELHAIYD